MSGALATAEGALGPALFEGEPFPVLRPLNGRVSPPPCFRGPGTPDNRRRAHNRRQLEEWLRMYNTRFPSAGRKGLMNLEELTKPGPSFGPLERGENWERLNDEDLWYSDRILGRLIFGADLGLPVDHPARDRAPLKRSNWPAYMLMCACYLDVDADDAAHEWWRRQRHHELGAKMQYDMLEKGISDVLDGLDALGHTLVVRTDEKARSSREAEQKRRRAERREVYWKLIGEDWAPGPAARETATICHCALSSVYSAIGTKKEAEDA